MGRIIVDVPIYISISFLTFILILLGLDIIKEDLTFYLLLGDILAISIPFFTHKIYDWMKKLNDIEKIIISFVKRVNKNRQKVTEKMITERLNIDYDVINKLINKKILKKKDLNIKLTRRARWIL